MNAFAEGQYNEPEKKSDRLINEIEHIRTYNNSLWMEILRIAMEHAPEQTKNVIRVINHNDEKIGGLLKELSK